MSFNEWEQVLKEFKKKKRTSAGPITYLDEWKHFCWQFLFLLPPQFISLLFSSVSIFVFCLLSHLEIIRCIVKSMIAASIELEEIFFFIWGEVGEGCPIQYTGIPNGLNTSLPFYWSKEPFSINNLIQILLFKIHNPLTYHIFCLKYFYHIFCTSVMKTFTNYALHEFSFLRKYLC